MRIELLEITKIFIKFHFKNKKKKKKIKILKWRGKDNEDKQKIIRKKGQVPLTMSPSLFSLCFLKAKHFSTYKFTPNNNCFFPPVPIPNLQYKKKTRNSHQRRYHIFIFVYIIFISLFGHFVIFVINYLIL